MQSYQVPRVVAVTSLGVGDSADQGNFLARMVQKTTLKHVLVDKELQEQRLRDSELDWTTIRPARLTNKPRICESPAVWHGPVPESKRLSWAASRATVANLILDTIEQHRYSRFACCLSE